MFYPTETLLNTFHIRWICVPTLFALKKEGMENLLHRFQGLYFAHNESLEIGINSKSRILKMNKLTTSLALVSAMLVAGTTQAAMVHFSGEVTSQTCKFTGLSGGSDLHEVAMGSVSQGALLKTGDTAGETNFSIKLSGCTTNDNVDLVWGQDNADQSNAGTLKNLAGAGAAENVNIQLTKVIGQTNEIINLGNQNNNGAQKITDGAGTYTFDYIAKYFATGAAKAGLVTSQASISIEYP